MGTVEYEASRAAARVESFREKGWLAELGTALTQLSGHLVKLGRVDDAVTAAAEAVEIGQGSLVRGSIVDRLDVARALVGFSCALSAAGRVQDAVMAAGEAVELCRGLPEDQVVDDLARALINLADRWSDVEQGEQALAAAGEAVELYRRTAARQPARHDAYRPALAGALTGLSRVLLRSGRGPQALAAAAEAVDLLRPGPEQAQSWQPDHAQALISLAEQLSALDRAPQALAAAGEALEIYQRLAIDRPEPYVSAVASAINTYRSLTVPPQAPDPVAGSALAALGDRLSGQGRQEEALVAISEAVEVFRQLAAERPEAFTPDLARVMGALGDQLWTLERGSDAVTATGEAVELYRRLATERPQAFEPDLGRASAVLGARLSQLGREDEAGSAVDRATAIRRRLSAAGQVLAKVPLDSSWWHYQDAGLADLLRQVGARDDWPGTAAADESRAVEDTMAWTDLKESFLDQRTIYPVTCAALPHVIEIAASRPPERLADFWIDIGLIVTAHGTVPDDLREGLIEALPIAERSAIRCLLDTDLRSETDCYHLVMACLALAGHRVGELTWQFEIDSELETICPHCDAENQVFGARDLDPPTEAPTLPDPYPDRPADHPWTRVAASLETLRRDGPPDDTFGPFLQVAVTVASAGVPIDTPGPAALCLAAGMAATKGHPAVARNLIALSGPYRCDECGQVQPLVDSLITTQDDRPATLIRALFPGTR